MLSVTCFIHDICVCGRRWASESCDMDDASCVRSAHAWIVVLFRLQVYDTVEDTHSADCT
jgi:hypothetical protein